MQIKGRYPEELREAAKAAAKRRALSLNDYLGQLISDDTGVPYSNQDALDLNGGEALKTA